MTLFWSQKIYLWIFLVVFCFVCLSTKFRTIRSVLSCAWN